MSKAKTLFTKKFHGVYENWETEGIQEIKTELNRQLGKIHGKTIDGLVEAIAFLKKDMLTTSPTIPKDTGNLRKSFFAVTSMGRVAVGNMSPSFKGRFASRLRRRHTQMVGGAVGKIHKRKNPQITFGFSAYYAGYVHEMDGDVKWTTPGSGAKYFEEALYRNKNVILQIIAQNIKIK